MIRYGEWVWEGTSVEVKPGPAEGAYDGHIFKELDTGESYTRIGGVWSFINLGLSFIKATKSGVVTVDASGIAHITFVTPFINVNYSVQLTVQDPGSGKLVAAFKKNKTINGFDIQVRDKNGNPKGPYTVSWLATRDYNP